MIKIEIQAAPFAQFSKDWSNKKSIHNRIMFYQIAVGLKLFVGRPGLHWHLKNKWAGGNPRPIGFVQKIDYFLPLMEVLTGKMKFWNPLLCIPLVFIGSNYKRYRFKAPVSFVWVHPHSLQNERPARASQKEKSGLLHGGQSSERALPQDSCACVVEYQCMYSYR